MQEIVCNYIDEFVKGKSIPYLDVSAYRDGKQIFRYYTGNTEITGKERLHMYSCTKLLTVVSAMRLVEEGKLSLEDDVEKYIPSFRDVYLLNGKGEKVPPKNKMKIKHLFTMSAGLDYDREKAPLKKLKAEQPHADTLTALSCLPLSPLNFEPGNEFLYSLCHDVLAGVVEVVSGMKYSEYVKKIILIPLGMENTSFRPKENETFLPCYDYLDEKLKLDDGKIFESFLLTDNYESGGAGVISTVDDYQKFADTLARDGKSVNGYRLLKSETIDEIRTEWFKKLSVKNNFTCVQGGDYGYGLGVRTRVKATDYGLPVGEFGWDGAAGSYVMIDKKNKVSVVIGMNILFWPNLIGDGHLKIVEQIYKNVL